jgi:LmbE family N-acetylglucosaminyl deacetylase
MNLPALKSKVINSIMNPFWVIQFTALKRNLPSNKIFPTFPFELEESSSCLIIAPHADDELVGCYQLIKKYPGSMTIFYCGLTGTNDSPVNRKTRGSEIKAFCENSAINLFTVEGDLQKSLLHTIKTLSPSVILLPPLIDWHTEHRLTHLLLYNALKEQDIKPQIFMYQISVPHWEKQITHTMPITKNQQTRKWKNFNHFYASQKNMPIKLFRCHERISGSYSGVYAAEAYVLISFKNWEKSLRFIQIKEKSELLNNLYRTSYSLAGIHRGNKISSIRNSLTISFQKDSVS